MCKASCGCSLCICIERERNRERGERRRDLKDMGHSPLTNKILCETKNLKAKENQHYAEILVLGYESLEERNCVGMGRRHPRTGSTWKDLETDVEAVEAWGHPGLGNRLNKAM